MATIITKNSSTASSVPTAAQLVQGELAVNVTDKRLFTKNASGTVVELGTNPSSLALPNGSVNGVAYLNASKVLTTGSALTFDGTTFTASNSAATAGNFKATNSTAQVVQLTASNDANTSVGLLVYGSAAGSFGMLSAGSPALYTAASELNLMANNASGVIKFAAGGNTEQMRLTSTGLGIGTSSVTDKLTLGSGRIKIGTGGLALYVGNDGTDNALQLVSGANIKFQSGSGYATNMLLDSSGNLGLGVTPSAWSTGKAFEIVSPGNALWSSTGYTTLLQNGYYNAGYKYGYTGLAGRYDIAAGVHAWFTAPSGTAGNAISFTQAMTLAATGNLLVGTTTDGGQRARIQRSGSGIILNLGDNVAQNFDVSSNAGSGSAGVITLDTPNGAAQAFSISGTERARIDSSGNLLVGTTTSGVGNAGGMGVGYNGGASYASIGHVSGTASGSVYVSFGYNGGAIGNITQNGTTGVLYNLTSDYRLKNNPVALIGSGEFIDALQPKTWDWWDGSGKGVGFIAHEFMEVAKYSGKGEKDAVDAEGNPVYQSIQPSSSEVMAYIVAEIQSLRKRLAALEAK